MRRPTARAAESRSRGGRNDLRVSASPRFRHRDDVEPQGDAYIVALRMLATRELSEAQIRQRLARREYADDEIDAAVARLKADNSIDDARVAGALARTEAGLRKRGRLRVKRRIEAAGIASTIAQRAVDETFAAIDADALMAAALEKRLRGRADIADDREFQRLYRFLSSQGFESDRILALLRSRKRRSG